MSEKVWYNVDCDIDEKPCDAQRHGDKCTMCFWNITSEKPGFVLINKTVAERLSKPERKFVCINDGYVFEFA